eukprot:1883330-Pleurochrysis_carterae.AAC.1
MRPRTLLEHVKPSLYHICTRVAIDSSNGHLQLFGEHNKICIYVSSNVLVGDALDLTSRPALEESKSSILALPKSAFSQ